MRKKSFQATNIHTSVIHKSVIEGRQHRCL